MESGGGVACAVVASGTAAGAAGCRGSASGGVSCEELSSRLRQLLLDFPTGILEGVRWSVLCKVYAERFVKPKGHNVFHGKAGVAPPTAAELLAARASLADVAGFEEDVRSPGDGWLRVLDPVALELCLQGRLTCWPLLARKLGEVVQGQGLSMPLTSLRLPQGEGDLKTALTAGTPGAGARLPDDTEVPGVLLAQLKPLLRRHWDPAFEERKIFFFKADGGSVSIKKMKHLVDWLVKWCARRRELNTATGATLSDVDRALEGPPLVLAHSQRHNDMVLCCLRAARLAELLAAPLVDEASKGVPAATSASSSLAWLEPPGRSEPPAEAVRHGNVPAVSSSSPPPRLGDTLPTLGDSLPQGCQHFCISTARGTEADSQRLQMLEEENNRLRAESAELRQRLLFEKELYDSEVSKLRVENEELKKRILSHSQLSPGGAAVPPGSSPTEMPRASATPAAQAQALAVAAPSPLHGAVSPAGALWNNSLGPHLQKVPGTPDAESSSDAAVATANATEPAPAQLSSRSVQHERRVIPSGFVERRKKEFEGRAGVDSSLEVPPISIGANSADAAPDDGGAAGASALYVQSARGAREPRPAAAPNAAHADPPATAGCEADAGGSREPSSERQRSTSM